MRSTWNFEVAVLWDPVNAIVSTCPPWCARARYQNLDHSQRSQGRGFHCEILRTVYSYICKQRTD